MCCSLPLVWVGNRPSISLGALHSPGGAPGGLLARRNDEEADVDEGGGKTGEKWGPNKRELSRHPDHEITAL